MAIFEKRVAFITLGCAKNEVDTEQMRSLLGDGKFCIVEPELAELIVVNTCAFIEEATQESIDTILEVSELYSGAKIIVAGCLASRYGEDILAEMPEISAILPVAEETALPDVLANLTTPHNSELAPPLSSPHDGELSPHLSSPRQNCEAVLGERSERNAGDLANEAGFAFHSPLTISKYVKISDGCDRFCSYCTIPIIRGRYKSTPLTEIASTVEKHINGGAKEITFIGQDTGIWGSDLPQKPNLAKLIATFAEKYPSVWFRFLYLQPEGISDELIDVVKTHDNICNYFDIPIQHVSPHLLKKMNREGSFEEYLSMFDRIREGVPEVNLRTTLMVGFPGETEEDFEELLSFISLAKLDKAAVFSYSREDGTNAYSYSDQIDDSVKLSRLQIIKDKLDNIAFSKNQSMIKNVFQCLVTNATENTPVIAATRLLAGAGEPRSGERNVGDLANEEGFAFHSRANDANPLNLSKLVARAQFQAPDIDGEIEFHGDSSLIGNFLDIRLTGSFGYDFEGEAIV